ncbi:hypothetical protein [Lishizhenia sp.]|uniref:hypothetical protein n=1 Tax=Lishizhenia sp. TaxID=2497594 RepID=UPI00299F1167|nr:hypothetical protein [Lishizhenia sp.]MDX1445892.1 hypothetical protein [Lishizhenia sp.]
MKSIFLALSTLLFVSTHAQTAKINLEKHHLSYQESSSAKLHNFGIPSDFEPVSMYDTLEYYQRGCIIAHKKYKINSNYLDTLCDIDFIKNYEASTDEINEKMLGGHVMVNFDQYENERKQRSQQPKKSSIPWYYGLFLLAFLPFIKLKQHEV